MIPIKIISMLTDPTVSKAAVIQSLITDTVSLRGITLSVGFSVY